MTTPAEWAIANGAGIYSIEQTAAIARSHGLQPCPETITDADLAWARTLGCAICGTSQLGVIALIGGLRRTPWKLAICPACHACQELYA